MTAAVSLPARCRDCLLWQWSSTSLDIGICVNGCGALAEPPRPRWCPLSPHALHRHEQPSLNHEHHWLKDLGKLRPYFEPQGPSDVPKPPGYRGPESKHAVDGGAP